MLWPPESNLNLVVGNMTNISWHLKKRFYWTQRSQQSKVNTKLTATNQSRQIPKKPQTREWSEGQSRGSDRRIHKNSLEEQDKKRKYRRQYKSYMTYSNMAQNLLIM